MRKTIRKWFWAWDTDKEEKWLNEMAATGLSLISVGLISYEFEETLPGEYQIRRQFMEHSLRHPETEKYIHFLEETGIQHVGTYSIHAYFRKKTADGAFELISDYDSRVKSLTVLQNAIIIANIPNLFNCWNMLNMFIQLRYPVFLFCSLLSLFVAAFFIAGIIKIRKALKKLKTERQIYE